MSFSRFLGGHPAAGRSAPERLPTDNETEAVRRIVARLESLPPEKARLLAGMAYVLARAANADMEITDVETQAIETVLVESGLDHPRPSWSPRWRSSRSGPPAGRATTW